MFVRPNGDRYEVIAGHRRLEALIFINAPTAFCQVFRGLSDPEAYDLAISENQDHGTLTDMERADICVQLQREGKTVEQIAQCMRWASDRQVFRHLKLAKEATPAIRREVAAGRLSTTVALVLLEHGFAEFGPDAQAAVLQLICESEMSVREVRAHLVRLKRELPPVDVPPRSVEPAPSAIREHKNGAFTITAPIDPEKPQHLHDTIESLRTALKRATVLERKLESATETSPPAPGNRSAEDRSPTPLTKEMHHAPKAED